jgi:hypothetical protein
MAFAGFEPCVGCGRGIPVDRFVDGKAACPWCGMVQDEGGEQVVEASSGASGARHPKVTERVEGAERVFVTRQGSCFGWFWLTFTTVHCGFMFYGLVHGQVHTGRHGPVIANPSFWHYLGFAAFYSIFFAVGFAFTLSRYTVRLRDDLIIVRYRLFPFVGWTWRLVAGESVKVSLAFRGARSNGSAQKAVVLVSEGKEVSFGSFLEDDVKQHLASAIDGFYNGETGGKADFIPGPPA